MQTVIYDRTMAAGVTSLYNRAVTGIPHCYPATSEDVAGVVGAAEAEDVRHEAAFVALEDDDAVGFVDTCVGCPEDWGEGDQGVIRFLWYEPGRRAAGQALLQAAHAHLATAGVQRVQAFPQEYRYPFYHLHAAYLSDRLGHVSALLGMDGYQRIRGEVILDWPGFEPVVPPLPDASAEVEVSLPEGEGELPGVEVQARLPTGDVGECVTVSCGEYAKAEEAQRWTEVYGLGVAERYQGEGWGRYLLMRALSEARKVGYENAVISTWLGNSRALLFYSNYGFRVVDWTYGHGREL